MYRAVHTYISIDVCSTCTTCTEYYIHVLQVNFGIIRVHVYFFHIYNIYDYIKIKNKKNKDLLFIFITYYIYLNMYVYTCTLYMYTRRSFKFAGVCVPKTPNFTRYPNTAVLGPVVNFFVSFWHRFVRPF